MQLVGILVVIVATLALLTGATVVFGSKTKDKLSAALFFLTVFWASLWAYSVTVFLNLPENATDIAPVVVAVIYITALLMVTALFGYASRFTQSKIGIAPGIIFTGVQLVLSAVIILRPELLYDSIKLNEHTGNIVNLRFDTFYMIYVAFFALVLVVYGVMLVAKILSRPPALMRRICLLLLIGPGICGVLSLCFDLILPFWRYDLIWVGPASIDFAIISFYYAILRYRMIKVRVGWMKVMSYVILVTTMALAYVAALFVLSSNILDPADLSVRWLILNFMMSVIVLTISPVLAEFMANVRSLLSINSIDVGYIAKRLNKMSQANADVEELTKFLADHLHFSFIGIVMNDRLYGSKEVDFSVKEVEIEAIENSSAPDEIWQRVRGDEMVEYNDLRAVVDLHDIDGRLFGRLAIGAPHSEMKLDKKEVSRLEMVVGLVAITLNSKEQKENDWAHR